MDVAVRISIVSKSVNQMIKFEIDDDKIIMSNLLSNNVCENVEEDNYLVEKSDGNYNYFVSKILFIIMMFQQFVKEEKSVE